MKDYGMDLFKGTAWYYTRYRPMYPSSLVRFLIKEFSLNGEGRLLDLGCGTGQLALRFSDWFEEIVGVDTEPEMLDEARRLSLENRVDNAAWLQGKAEDRAHDRGSFRLITIAKAFHWMDRESVLEILYNSSDENGGIAVIDNEQREPLLWQLKVDEVVKRWLGNERRAGNSTYSHPTERHEEIIAKSSFKKMNRQQLPTQSYKWTIDSIIGHLYSTSFASKRLFGDNLKRFEDDLTSTLLDINSAGVFTEESTVCVITAFK